MIAKPSPLSALGQNRRRLLAFAMSGLAQEADVRRANGTSLDFYLESSLTKGSPFFCQSASSIMTAVTLVKPISLSYLAASVARPPVAHCTYISRFT
jgi:hypothetical protein